MRLIQDGPRNAKIVIVGEAPGATEEQTGKPFQGGSGMLLDRMLEAARIRRSECFITNVCHVRPEKNEFAWFLKPANQSHLLKGMMQLKADIAEIRPNLVIALGAQPLRILTGKQGIDNWRGSILSSTLVPGIKVIGTYHPAYILRVYNARVVAEFDLRRCAEESKYPELNLPEYDFALDPPAPEREALAREMSAAEWLAVDIECWSTDSGWRLACVGFSDRKGRALVIPATDHSALSTIRHLLISPAKKIFQNGQFDVTVLRAEGFEVTNWQWDTMLAHHALFPESASGGDELSAMAGKKRKVGGLAKGLAFQTSIYTRQPYYKDDGKAWKETNDLQMFWRYNALDAAITREIRDVQEAELTEYGTLHVHAHSMSMSEPLLAATKRGLRVDFEVREAMRTKILAEIENLQKFLDTGAGKPVNVKSTSKGGDVQWLLYEHLKLPTRYNKVSGNPTADKDAITYLGGKYKNPLLHAILRIREKRDLVERYLNTAVSKDGRMRCTFDITGTRSGRLSSRASLDGSGTNLQNQPVSMRRMFIADPGKTFVYRDFSQAEARVVAYLARCRGLIELFEDPTRDIHKENAARIFGILPGQVNKEQRYLAKRVVHASNYGMREDRLVEIINQDAEETGVRITEPQAKSILDRYFMIYPEIHEIFWGDVKRELRKSLTLNTPFGRKRTFFGRWDDTLLREAYSYIPQSTVGDLCCKALVNCYNEIELARPEWGAELLVNVHDSLLMQCNDDAVEHVARAMEQAMKISITIHGETFLIPTDCQIGKNWGLKSEDNPLGLEEYEYE